jgi:polyhydroxybutyrate depolymerase
VNGSLNVGGLQRTYELTVPDFARHGGPRPLLIELHGGGGSGQGIERLARFGPLAERDGVVLVAPDGIRRSWNDGRRAPRIGATAGGVDDVGFIVALIDDLAHRYPIDLGRVYVAGMSNGAMMAGRLAATVPDRVAAFAQVAGTAPADAASWCHPGRPVPIIQIHGTADMLVPYVGGPIGAARRPRRAFAGRGQVIGVEAWAALWVANNGAVGPVVHSLPPDTTVRVWQGSTPRSDLEFWRVKGGGHTWPGGAPYLPERLVGAVSRTFDATDEIWRFLSSHRL